MIDSNIAFILRHWNQVYMVIVNLQFLVFEFANLWSIIDCEIKFVSIAKADLV
jgi:hypothetical protein